MVVVRSQTLRGRVLSTVGVYEDGIVNFWKLRRSVELNSRMR
jgi:hypothetical protein